MKFTEIRRQADQIEVNSTQQVMFPGRCQWNKTTVFVLGRKKRVDRISRPRRIFDVWNSRPHRFLKCPVLSRFIFGLFILR